MRSSTPAISIVFMSKNLSSRDFCFRFFRMKTLTNEIPLGTNVVLAICWRASRTRIASASPRKKKKNARGFASFLERVIMRLGRPSLIAYLSVIGLYSASVELPCTYTCTAYKRAFYARGTHTNTVRAPGSRMSFCLAPTFSIFHLDAFPRGKMMFETKIARKKYNNIYK